jgi:hypothetical protein
MSSGSCEEGGEFDDFLTMGSAIADYLEDKDDSDLVRRFDVGAVDVDDPSEYGEPGLMRRFIRANSSPKLYVDQYQRIQNAFTDVDSEEMSESDRESFKEFLRPFSNLYSFVRHPEFSDEERFDELVSHYEDLADLAEDFEDDRMRSIAEVTERLGEDLIHVYDMLYDGVDADRVLES